jgi:uncharacterized protein (TIGR02265 family)
VDSEHRPARAPTDGKWSPRRFVVTPDTPLEGEIDEEARVASVPAQATTKGMYLASLMQRLAPEELDAVLPKLRSLPRHATYQPFLDYPFGDAVVLLHAVARKLHPGKSLLEGLRLVGRGAVKVYLSSQPGRVVKAMIQGPEDALLRLPDIWRATDPQSSASATSIGPRHVAISVEGFPAWMDCGLIGTIEQIAMNQGVAPRIEVSLDTPTRGMFDVHW